MTDVELDLYADDLEQDFSQAKVRKTSHSFPDRQGAEELIFSQDSEFAGGDGGVDLYDDVMVPPSSQGDSKSRNNADGPAGGGGMSIDRPDRNSESSETNGGGMGGGSGGGSNYHNHHSGNSNMSTPSYPGRRHQLYIGNLTWVSGMKIKISCFVCVCVCES